LLQISIIHSTIIITIIDDNHDDAASATFHHEIRLPAVNSAHDFCISPFIKNPQLHPQSDITKVIFWI
jgi:hypothetical protein